MAPLPHLSVRQAWHSNTAAGCGAPYLPDWGAHDAGTLVHTFHTRFRQWLKALPRRPPLVPRQPYVGPLTCLLLRQLRDWRAQSRYAQRRYTLQWLKICLIGWRTGAACDSRERTHLHCLRLYLVAIAQQAQATARRAHDSARRDKARHFQVLTSEAEQTWHVTGQPDAALVRLR